MSFSLSPKNLNQPLIPKKLCPNNLTGTIHKQEETSNTFVFQATGIDKPSFFTSVYKLSFFAATLGQVALSFNKDLCEGSILPSIFKVLESPFSNYNGHSLSMIPYTFLASTIATGVLYCIGGKVAEKIEDREGSILQKKFHTMELIPYVAANLSILAWNTSFTLLTEPQSQYYFPNDNFNSVGLAIQAAGNLPISYTVYCATKLITQCFFMPKKEDRCFPIQNLAINENEV